MSQKYTVISTSGYHGDNWHYQAQFNKRADAVNHAEEVKQPHATSKTYHTAVIGDIKVDGYNFRGDTRRTGMKEKHLCSRNCFIADDLPH